MRPSPLYYCDPADATDRAMTESARLAELRRPPAPSDPRLFAPTRLKVLRGFIMVGRVPAMPGDVVTIDYATAQDMVALRKAEYLSADD